MEWSNYQKEIIEYYENYPHDNMIVSALAGTGKTTLLKELSDRSTKSDIYVAFNNTIAAEMAEKITNPKVKVKTLHGLAYSYMLYNVENEGGHSKGIGRTRSEDKAVTLDNLKPYKIVEEIMYESGRRYDFTEKMFYSENYVTLYNLARLTRSDMSDPDVVERLCNEYNLFIDYENDFERPTAYKMSTMLEAMDKASLDEFDSKHTIDFTDMLYITYLKIENKEWQVPPWGYYTNIFIDESQDTSNLQLSFLKFIKRKGGRYVFVGDYHQCQPYGTKIALIDGEEKNIEDVQVGDKVVQYSSHSGSDRSFVGYHSRGLHNDYTVIDKQEFYANRLITITNEDGQSSSYTSNHMCYAKFNREATQEAVCLYLMQRNDGLFRIGKVHMYATQKVLGIKQRTRSEGFDRCWILDIYDTNNEAWVNEQKYSLKYQIPQVIFQNEKVIYDDNDREKIYEGVIDGMRGRAIALLDEFGRDINYPFYERDNIFSHLARDHGFEIPACNLIPKYMDCLTYHPEIRPVRTENDSKSGEARAPRPIYKNITKLENKYGLFKVVGLTTSHYHTYIADGIVTHNSIYSFAGANTQSFNLIPKLFAPIKSFDLPICYRCPKSHLKRVNRQFDIPIQPRPNAPEGKIYTIEKHEIVGLAKVGDMVIARKNKWLTDVILALAKNGTPIYMQDKEMVENIKRTIIKQKSKNLQSLRDKLGNVVKKYNQQVHDIILNANIESQEGNETPNTESDVEKRTQITSTNAKIDNIEFIIDILNDYMKKHPDNTPDDFLRYLGKLLNTEDPHDCVRLTSVHKAKGLEAQNVFVLNEAKVCVDPRNSWEQNEQEKNLSYISITRAKNNLYLVVEPK